jgi:hypothetical protein
MFGETERRVEELITTERVTSVVAEAAEAAEGDGDVAELTAIPCP